MSKRHEHFVPPANERFKPKLHGTDWLRDMVRQGWFLRGEAMQAREDYRNAAASIRDELARRYPAEDMAVLRRYGQTRVVKQTQVQLRDTNSGKCMRFDCEPLEIPGNSHYGGFSDGEFARLYTDELPPATRAMAEEVFAMDNANLTDMDEAWKVEPIDGKYPTWGELRKRFPVIVEFEQHMLGKLTARNATSTPAR